MGRYLPKNIFRKPQLAGEGPSGAGVSAKGGVRWRLLLLLVVLGLLCGVGLYTASRFTGRSEPAPSPDSRATTVRLKIPPATQPALKKASPPSTPKPSAPKKFPIPKKAPAPKKSPVPERQAAPGKVPPPAPPPSKPPVDTPAKTPPKAPALPEALLTITQAFQPAPPETDDATIPSGTPARQLVGGENPVALRQVLKTLQINVHLYDADPERRIVFINARRYKPEDRIWGTNLVLKEIIPEGVTLDHKGQAVILRYR